MLIMGMLIMIETMITAIIGVMSSKALAMVMAQQEQ